VILTAICQPRSLALMAVAEKIRSELITDFATELRRATEQLRLVRRRLALLRDEHPELKPDASPSLSGGIAHVLVQLEHTYRRVDELTVEWAVTASLLHHEDSVSHFHRALPAEEHGWLLSDDAKSSLDHCRRALPGLSSDSDQFTGIRPSRRIELSHIKLTSPTAEFDISSPPWACEGAVMINGQSVHAFTVELTLADAVTGLLLGPCEFDYRFSVAADHGHGSELIRLVTPHLAADSTQVLLSPRPSPLSSDMRPHIGEDVGFRVDTVDEDEEDGKPKKEKTSRAKKRSRPSTEAAAGLGLLPAIVWSKLPPAERESRMQEAREHLQGSGIDVDSMPPHKRVAVWNPLTHGSIAGDGAPKMKDAVRFFARYPYLQVHNEAPLRRGEASKIERSAILSAEEAGRVRSKGVVLRVTRVRSDQRGVDLEAENAVIERVIDYLNS
jgi:hypothetical protein